MKKFFLFTGLFFSLVFAYSQTTSEKLETYLQAAEKAGLINGSVLIVQNGIPLIDKGIGVRNAETKSANSPETIYQIGSVTKQFTAAIILQLAEQKKLQISDKLSKYFPDFPNGDKINIEHLLTHTSGLYNYTRNTELMNEPDKHANQEKMIALFSDKPLDFEPGAKYSYSNSGYLMLGYIIEKVTGKSYYQVVREWIFKPLQMSHSGFNFTGLTSTNKATGYSSMRNNNAVATKIVDSSVSFSAGAVYSTTGDLYKWDQAVMDGRLLQKTSWNNALTPRMSNYGFGFMIDSVNGVRRVSHAGGIHGFAAFNMIIPSEKLAIILLSNNISVNPSRLADDLLAVIYNKPYKLPEPVVIRNEVKLEEAILKQYAGDYELAPNFHIVIKVESGKLMGQATGQPPFELFAEKENFFFLKVVEAQVEFFKNGEGKVDKLILYQNGAKLAGVKKPD